MEENTIKNELENKPAHLGGDKKGVNNQQQIAGAIIIAGFIIAGAVLLKGSSAPVAQNPTNNEVPVTTLAPVKAGDRILGNGNAKVTLVIYEDFQCPFCGKFFQESEQTIRDTYVKNGDVRLVYRDFAFLGPESIRAAEAARCAGDQGKFWEYHDYLFTHQNGENQGNFSDPKLKSFAVGLGLNNTSFDQCLDGNKYAQAVADSKSEASTAGVTGTPKGFILRNGKIMNTIDGAIPLETVKQEIDAALK